MNFIIHSKDDENNRDGWREEHIIKEGQEKVNRLDYSIAKKEFEKYISTYDKNNGSINLKIIHTYEVVSKSEYIAQNLNLSKEDIYLSKIIALLHDIGRFEQIKEFGDFDDNKFEHAGYGVKILFGDTKLIRKFIMNDKYDDIIKKAIYNHNKLNIEDGLDERTLLHCKIIRDADKTDNFRVEATTSFEDSWPNIYNPDTIYYEKISDKIYNDFLNHKSITFSDRKTMWDYYLCVIAFIYDLNYNASLEYIMQNNYIDVLFDKVKTKNKQTMNRMEIMRKCIIDYTTNRIH